MPLHKLRRTFFKFILFIVAGAQASIVKVLMMNAAGANLSISLSRRCDTDRRAHKFPHRRAQIHFFAPCHFDVTPPVQLAQIENQKVAIA